MIYKEKTQAKNALALTSPTKVNSSRIYSVGKYIPSNRIYTKDLIREMGPDKFDIEDDYIEKNLGIRELRHADSDAEPSDLAIAACEDCLAKSDVQPDQIDYVIFCAVEGDCPEPATAHTVQKALGLNARCQDVSNACLGFMTGIEFAEALIISGKARYVLVCTGEKTSRIALMALEELKAISSKKVFEKRVGLLTVGDAGGAMIIGPARAGSGFVRMSGASQGQYADLCFYNTNNGYLEAQMLMAKICAVTLKLHKRILQEAVDAIGFKASDIDLLISHQVGAKPYELLKEMFGVEDSVMSKTYDVCGNLTTATLPVNLAMAMENNQVKPGDKMYIALSGSGISVIHGWYIF